MTNENLISTSFTPEEIKEAIGHVNAILALFDGRLISLTPDERREYGRIGNKTENWARKVIEYIKNQPDFTPAFIDAAETQADYAAREALKPLINILTSLANQTDDTAMVLGADVYQAELGYYQNVKMLAKQNVNGAKAIYDDLAAQFPGNSRKK